MYKKFKHICPLCQESLHNGESVELHHIIPQKTGGKYRIENVLPLHQICHQQVSHGNRTLERLKIALTPTDENQTAEDKNKRSRGRRVKTRINHKRQNSKK